VAARSVAQEGTHAPLTRAHTDHTLQELQFPTMAVVMPKPTTPAQLYAAAHERMFVTLLETAAAAVYLTSAPKSATTASSSSSSSSSSSGGSSEPATPSTPALTTVSSAPSIALNHSAESALIGSIAGARGSARDSDPSADAAADASHDAAGTPPPDGNRDLSPRAQASPVVSTPGALAARRALSNKNSTGSNSNNNNAAPSPPLARAASKPALARSAAGAGVSPLPASPVTALSTSNDDTASPVIAPTARRRRSPPSL
jgi:hypothetical protein